MMLNEVLIDIGCLGSCCFVQMYNDLVVLRDETMIHKKRNFRVSRKALNNISINLDNEKTFRLIVD